MIRIRRADGSTEVLGPRDAVEVIDPHEPDRLAMVCFMDRKKTLRALIPGDPLFNGYCRTQGMRPANVHFHDAFQGKAMS